MDVEKEKRETEGDERCEGGERPRQRESFQRKRRGGEQRSRIPGRKKEETGRAAEWGEGGDTEKERKIKRKRRREERERKERKRFKTNERGLEMGIKRLYYGGTEITKKKKQLEEERVRLTAKRRLGAK